MISRLEISNFKCLRDVKLDLGPFTVLIGPNDSGKSSILESVRLLARSTEEQLTQVLVPSTSPRLGSSLENLVWQKDVGKDMLWTVAGTANGKAFEYSLRIPPTWPQSQNRRDTGGRIPAERLAFGKANVCFDSFTSHDIVSIGNEHFTAGQPHTVMHQARHRRIAGVSEVAEAFSSTELYRLDPSALRAEGRPTSRATLTSSGENLVAAVDSIFGGPVAAARIQLESALHDAIPTLNGISLPPSEDGTKRIEFVLTSDARVPITVPAKQASDGALLLTAYLALAYGNTPDILLIEEPENGLHPTRMKQVVELLRRMSRGEVGNRPRQVIITTHSPILLNYVQPNEVRIVTRDPKTGTHVFPMTNVRDLDKLTDEFAVGEMWYLLGEEALIKGAQQ